MHVGDVVHWLPCEENDSHWLEFDIPLLLRLAASFPLLLGGVKHPPPFLVDTDALPARI